MGLIMRNPVGGSQILYSPNFFATAPNLTSYACTANNGPLPKAEGLCVEKSK